MIEPIALPRGAFLHAERVEGARSFSVGFWFPVGSRHEAPHERGFVHFIEHLFFKGTVSRSALDIARAIDRVGGYLNAFTERDALCVHCTLPAKHWRLAIELLADLCFRSSFPPDEVEMEREVIVSEILASFDDPEELSHDLMLARIWPKDPLSRPIAGTEEDVRAATRDALLEFRDRMLVPGRLLVTAAGPIDGADLAAELEAVLPLGDSAKAAATAAFSEPRFFPIVDYVPARLSQSYLLVAIPLHPPFGPEDFYSMSALNGAFGESMSSRLFQQLREREGLCYSVGSAFSMDRTEGLWLAQASSSPDAFPALLSSMLREIEALSSTRPLSDEELAESISRLEGSYDLALEDTEFRMKRLARQAMQAEEVLDVEETRNRILGVGGKAIARMIGRVFGDVEPAIFAYGSIGSKGRRVLEAIRRSRKNPGGSS
ncbi:MAG TPA: pitrilysin family protein [Rectinemataceae bacterium]|nr:pitrilysin family protein [Rectinemataceae bacterium]